MRFLLRLFLLKGTWSWSFFVFISSPCCFPVKRLLVYVDWWVIKLFMMRSLRISFLYLVLTLLSRVLSFNLSICYNSMKISREKTTRVRERVKNSHKSFDYLSLWPKKLSFNLTLLTLQLTSHRLWPKVNGKVIFQWNT